MRAMDGARCLVTGGSGFLGRNLIPALVGNGAKVLAVGRNAQRLQPLKEIAETVTADLAQPETARALVENFQPDFIYHLSGNVSGAAGLNLVLPMFEDNAAATVYLLNAAAGRVRRVLTVGSIEEYSTRPTALTPYAVAKRAASYYADYFCSVHSLPLTQLVLHFAYGPHQPRSKFIPSIITSYLAGRTPQIGMPHRKCDFVFIDDVVAAFLSAVEKEPQSSPLEIKSGESISLQEVAEQIRFLIDPSAPAAVLGVPDRPLPDSNVESSRNLLDNWGWRPVINRQKGLEKTIDWYRNNGECRADKFRDA